MISIPFLRSRSSVVMSVLVTGLLGLLALALTAAQPLHIAAAQTQPTPFPLFFLPDPRLSTAASSSSLALGRDNRTLVTANTINNSMSHVRVPDGVLIAEIRVGADPRSVALTSDDETAVVANRGDGTLSLVTLADGTVRSVPLGGAFPYAVLVEGTERAYVSLQGSSQIVEVDLIAGQVLRRVAVPPNPSGLALWGDFLYVTHFWSGELTLVYLPDGVAAATLSTGFDVGLSPGIEIDISRGLAYLPQTRSNASQPDPTFDSLVFPIINRVNLGSLTVDRAARIGLDSADRPLNMPFATALDRFQEILYVANAGSDRISVIDLNSGLVEGDILVGANPRGLLLNRDNSLLFVNNALQGTLSIIDTGSLQIEDDLVIASPANAALPVDVQLGASLFYSATDPRMSYGGWVSCANCHFDGSADGRTWGGRSTPPLYGLPETAPYTWDGAWDELADVELHLRQIQSGAGLIRGTPNEARGAPNSGQSADLDSLVSYLNSLTGPSQSPIFDAAQVARGQSVFETAGCAECHTPPLFTDLQRHDIGTGGAFDTPSLRWLRTSAPYFHDGSADNLREVFLLPGAHRLLENRTFEEINALAVYLVTLPVPGE